MEFVSSLPQEMKYKADEPKMLLKSALRDIVPGYILYGQKRGFEPPWNFIGQMCKNYSYKTIKSDHCFFNSMLADKLLNNLL